MDRGQAKTTDSGFVPPALLRLVPELDLTAAEIIPITALETKVGPRATFCLQSSDGKRVKLRIVRNTAKARRMQSVRHHLHDGPFARILARHENYLLEEWVDGTALNQTALSNGLLTRCGRMLGEVHGRTLTEHRRQLPETRPSTTSRRCPEWASLNGNSVIGGVPSVVAYCDGVTDLYAGRSALSIATFVQTTSCFAVSRPCSIDNANLSIGYFDEDIARTWYRWPMTQRQWKFFLEGYSTRRDIRSYLAHAPFWMILVLARATLFRHRAQASHADYPRRLLTGFFVQRLGADA